MTTYLFEISATDKEMKVEYPTKFDNYPATNFTELVALTEASAQTHADVLNAICRGDVE